MSTYKNPVTIRLPPNTRCEFTASARAWYRQRVTITADDTTTTLSSDFNTNGSMTLPNGETNYVLGARPQERYFTLRFEAQPPNGSYRLSEVKDPVFAQRGSSATYTLHAEDTRGQVDHTDTILEAALTPA